MPDTHGFEVVAEVGVAVLRKFLKSAWDNGGTSDPGAFPRQVVAPDGLALGPYAIKSGTVTIPDAGLGLDMAPEINGVAVELGTQIHVEMDPATVPINSLKLLDFPANIKIRAPFGIVPDTGINVGVIFEGMPESNVQVTLPDGSPIGAISLDMIKEYIHKLYEEDGTAFPHVLDLPDQSWSGFSADVHIEFYDDENDPNRRIEVSSPAAGTVAVSLPTYLRLSDVKLGLIPVPSPLGVTTRITLTAPLVQSDGQIETKLTQATVAVGDLTPALGPEGVTYTADKPFASTMGIDLDDVLKAAIQARGAGLAASMGDITIMVPTVADIQDFIASQVYDELQRRRFFGVWTPEMPENSPVEVVEARPRSLAEALAIGINPGPGADDSALGDFIPGGQPDPFAVGLSRAKVLQLIDDIVHKSREDGGFGGVPQTLSVDGYEIYLKDLSWDLIGGYIHFVGSVTIYDICCGINYDADDFWADVDLYWGPGADGGQTLYPYLADSGGAGLEGWEWLLSALLGGIIGIIIAAVIDGIANNLGASIMGEEVGGQMQVLGPWPQQLQGIGTVTSTFNEDVIIQTDGIVFYGAISSTGTHSSALVAGSDPGGPYAGTVKAAVELDSGFLHPAVSYEWKLGDGAAASGSHVSHTYLDNGLYIARLTGAVNQSGGATTIQYARVRIRNTTPSVNAGPDIEVDEGTEASFSGSFTDPEFKDKHEAIWDWGDDTLPSKGTVVETHNPPQATGVVTGRHAYCRAGEFVITLRLRDENGGVTEDKLKVKVNNVRPEVSAKQPFYAYPGVPAPIEAEFTDPGWCEKHRAFWKPGDYSPELPAIVREINEPPFGFGIAVLLHRYAVCATYFAECRVIDDMGGRGYAFLPVQVIDVRNRGFEDGFRMLKCGAVANEWEPYTSHAPAGIMAAAGTPGTAEFAAEEFVVRAGQRSQCIVGRGPFRAGIRQKVGANPRWDYQVVAWYHLDANHDGACRLGVDPTGGIDPAAASVQWYEGSVRHEWAPLLARVTAPGNAATIFLEASGDETGAKAFFDEVTLTPYPCPLPELKRPKPEPQEPEERCVNWREVKEAHSVPAVYEKDGFTFQSASGLAMQVVLSGAPQGQGKLLLPDRGTQVTLPFVADRVVASIIPKSKSPIKMIALDSGHKQMSRAGTETGDATAQRVEVKAHGIVYVHFPRGAALLIELCCYRQRDGSRVEMDEVPVLQTTPQLTRKARKRERPDGRKQEESL